MRPKMTVYTRIEILANAAGRNANELLAAFHHCAHVWGDACAIRMLEMHELEFEL